MADPDDALAARLRRRTIFETKALPWHIEQVPPEATIRGQTRPHPARHTAVFVVHGIGEQARHETAALLRSGFDDALVTIEQWQVRNNKRTFESESFIPPPYIREGYWGDYSDIGKTFDEDLKTLDTDARTFFDRLWKLRVMSTFRTYRWFLAQQIRLLHPRVICDVGFFAWLTYFPFQITSGVTLTLALLFKPRIVSGFLADVRIYVDPKGVTERAIVQRIDQGVAESFMQLLGMDADFNSLKKDKCPSSGGTLPDFTRVVWVAHSLGTVISYNVLGDLFTKARAIQNDPASTEIQRKNVARFRKSLRRFVTMGSPLDKIAYLFKDKALTSWPNIPRSELLEAGKGDDREEWWVNYYHVLDPVSGSLESPVICYAKPPANLHIRPLRLPGWAHVSYWYDELPLRYILSRTFGKEALEDRKQRPYPAVLLTILGFIAHLLQFSLGLLIILSILHLIRVLSFDVVWKLLVPGG